MTTSPTLLQRLRIGELDLWDKENLLHFILIHRGFSQGMDVGIDILTTCIDSFDIKDSRFNPSVLLRLIGSNFATLVL